MRWIALALAGVMAAGSLAAAGYVQAAVGAGAGPALLAAGAVAAGAALLARAARRPTIIALAVAAAVGLCIRGAAAWWLSGSEPANDPLSYLMMSQALLDGEGLIARGGRPIIRRSIRCCWPRPDRS